MVKEEKDILIFGRHPVLDAIQGGQAVNKVVLQQGVRGEFEKELREHCKRRTIPMQVVPKERMQALVRGNHQGVVAWLSSVPFQQLTDILPLVFERGETPLFVMLDGVTDVRNFGAIARSAEVCGAHALVMGKKSSAQVNAEAIKASAGALTKIPVCREASLMTAVQYLQESGVQVFASSLEAAEPIYDLDLTAPAALVLGSEGKGVNPAILQEADHRFWIPQKGTTDSFNVSVAAGIMLYEVLRQRRGMDGKG